MSQLKELIAKEIGVPASELSDEHIKKLLWIARAFFYDEDLDNKVSDLAKEIETDITLTFQMKGD